MSKRKRSQREAEEALRAGGQAQPAGTSTPPTEGGPVALDYTVGSTVFVLLKPDTQQPGGVKAEPLVKGKPPFFVMAGDLPPNFNPATPVEVKVIYTNPAGTMGRAELVGPADAVELAKVGFEQATTATFEYWKQSLLGKELKVGIRTDHPDDHREFDVIRRAGRKGDQVEAVITDDQGHYAHFPLHLRVVNIPANWQNPNGLEELPLRVTSVVQSADGKRTLGEAYAVGEDFKQPPSPEDLAREAAERAARDEARLKTEAERKVKEETMREQVVALDKVISGTARYPFNRDQDRQNLKQEGKFWVWKGQDVALETDQFGWVEVEVLIEVPKGWNPNVLAYDADGVVFLNMEKAGIRGDRLVVYAQFEGFDPTQDLPSAPKAEVGKTGVVFEGAKMLAQLRPLLGTADVARVEPLLAELDTADMRQALNLPARLERVKEIETILEEAIDVLAGDKEAIKDKEGKALKRIAGLREAVSRMEAEIRRIEGEIATARAVVSRDMAALSAKELALKADREAQIAVFRKQQKRDDEGVKLTLADGSPLMIEHAVEIRRVDENIVIDETEDIDLLRKKLAQQQAVLVMRDKWLNHGAPPKRDGDLNYRDLEFTEDFWFAELIIPDYEARIAELERIAAGQPAPTPPPPPPVVTGGPPLVAVPEPAPAAAAPAPAPAVEPAPVPVESVMTRYDRLVRDGFREGEVIRFTRAAHEKLGYLFTPGQPAPSEIRIRTYRLDEKQVDIDFPPNPNIFTIGFDFFHRLTQETDELRAKLTRAGVLPEVTLILDNTAVDGMLKERLNGWLEEHAGLTLPTKLRVVRAEWPGAELLFEADPQLGLGELYLPMEELMSFIPEHLKTSAEPGWLKTAEVTHGLETVRPSTPEIAAVLAEVRIGQTWVYTGRESDYVRTGGDFVIVDVNQETGAVLVRSAKEVMRAFQAKDSPVTLRISALNWPKLPKRLKSDPVSPAGVSAPRAVVEVAVRPPVRVEVSAPTMGEYTYTGAEMTKVLKPGPDLHMFPGARITATEFNAATRMVTFIVEGHPKPLTMRVEQWNFIQKEPVTDTQALAPAPTPVTIGLDVEIDPSLERAPAPAAGEQLQAHSMTELFDVLRDPELLELMGRAVDQRAGFFSKVFSFFDRPVTDAVKRMRSLVVMSADVLSRNGGLVTDLTAVEQEPGADAIRELLFRESIKYRQAEVDALDRLTTHFGTLANGQATDKALEGIPFALNLLERQLDEVKKANQKARDFLQKHPRKIGPPTPAQPAK